MLSSIPVLLPLAALAPLASAHIAMWTPSMYGFNPFDQWWFVSTQFIPLVDTSSSFTDAFPQHGFLDYPPNAGDVFELPAGGSINAELTCDKGASSSYASSEGGNAGFPTNWPCPGQDSSQFHTTGIDDTKGCAIAIADKTDGKDVQPNDFTIISVNQTCVWYANTEFQIPAQMPACSGPNCVCAWFWIHSDDSGSEQRAVTTQHGSVANPGNCTIGPKYPMYWMQAEGNNVRPPSDPRDISFLDITMLTGRVQMFEGYYDVPVYGDKMGFHDGAQNDIFQDAYVSSLGPGSAPTSSANARRDVPVAQATPAPEARGMLKRHKRMLDLAGHGSL
ncbi:uncharacterized protein B0H18DRAFT_1123859 [Fomitopsis serialis]|uniref:uncharacterized protein n=1 Tax=Fomitopsis serialis TaxID=139415 RepID=UPI0020079794|nr:uncharacterized protein B0H18DRAFT_1123859 [Neoantrodia serialis]KAH9917021.1 hypothetical protein B0H18DRAFT_1123859 [Neoantrodia serialis]